MVPITALYAAIAAILIIFLSINVVRSRLGEKVTIGDGGNARVTAAIRMHGNAIEYLPLGLILMACLELEHGSWILLHIIGILLIVGRIAHFMAFRSTTGPSSARSAAFVTTVIALLLAAAALLLHVLLFAPALVMQH